MIVRLCGTHQNLGFGKIIQSSILRLARCRGQQRWCKRLLHDLSPLSQTTIAAGHAMLILRILRHEGIRITAGGANYEMRTQLWDGQK